MNRADKRILAREHQKIEKREAKKQKGLMNWFHNWTPEQKQFHKNMVSAMLDEVNEITEKVLDTSYIAAMIEKLDISLEQCEEVAELANIYMVEVKKIIDEKKEGYFNMIKDEKLRQEIKEEAKIIIKENGKINNLRIIDNLKENHKLPAKDFQIIIKEARQELDEAAMKELESSIDKDIPKNATGELITYPAFEGEHGFEIPLENKKHFSDMLLEGLNKIPPKNIGGLEIESIKVKGKYGRYEKSQEGVKIGDTTYKNIKHIDDCIKNLDLQVEGHEKIINDQMQELKNQLEKLYKDKEEHLEKYLEIKAVFAM